MMMFWVGVIGVIAWLIIRSNRAGSGSSRPAREILSERYARGEIDTEEYHNRIDALR
jgi:putative membrane protein